MKIIIFDLYGVVIDPSPFMGLKPIVYEGIPELLRSLHDRGFVLAVNTSCSEKKTVTLLEQFGIKELFDFLGTSDISESKVEKFQIINQKYSEIIKNGAEVVFITDTLVDLRDADTARVPTIGATWACGDPGYFTRESHSNLIKSVHSVSELTNFLLK